MEDMQRLGNQVFVIASAFAVADMQVTLGHLGEAEKALRQAIQQAAAQGQEAESITAHHHLGLALLAHERGDDQATAGHLQTAADLGPHTSLVDWPHRWHLSQARLKESAREWDAALELLNEAKRVYVKNPVPILQPVEAHKARICLKQGRLEKAQAWVRERSISMQDGVRYLDEYDHLTLARVRLAEGSFAGVNDLLEQLLALAETQKRIGSVIEILLTQALIHQAQSNQPQALAALERALVLAEPEGYLRIFLDEGEPMRSLLLNFRSRHEKQATHLLLGYVGKILADFPQPVATTPKPKIENLKSQMIQPLSQRELDVLRLIAQGLSNREISERLFLALSTVKGHTRIIFDKLQVQRRTEAVARAHELGLL
jgi:LuxR family maltose regulon positive regulatory protein